MNFGALIAALLYASLTSSSVSAVEFKNIKWELVRAGNGIDVYRGDTGQDGLYAAKGIGVVPASLAKVASVLLDPERRVEWFPDLISSYIVKTVSPNERFEYMAVRTPFPLANRDFIYRGKFTYDRETKTMVISFASEILAETPETNLVRGRIVASAFTLRERSDGFTVLEHVAAINPRGYVPTWIVNLIQTNVPFNMISNLRFHVANRKIAVRQEVIDQMK
jgi:hypothetical protein